jgi:hypothetical protein
MALFDNAPARVRNCVTHHGCDCREYVMERLPDYEAAVDALERLVKRHDRLLPGQNWTQDQELWEQARAALARLREQVPA